MLGEPDAAQRERDHPGHGQHIPLKVGEDTCSRSCRPSSQTTRRRPTASGARRDHALETAARAESLENTRDTHSPPPEQANASPPSRGRMDHSGHQLVGVREHQVAGVQQHRPPSCAGSAKRSPPISTGSATISPKSSTITPSGSFRPLLIVGLVSPGGAVFSGRLVYYPTRGVGRGWSAGGCVLVDCEQVGESLLGGAHVGEHALHAGTSLAAVMVEQHGLLDASELVE